MIVALFVPIFTANSIYRWAIPIDSKIINLITIWYRRVRSSRNPLSAPLSRLYARGITKSLGASARTLLDPSAPTAKAALWPITLWNNPLPSGVVITQRCDIK